MSGKSHRNLTVSAPSGESRRLLEEDVEIGETIRYASDAADIIIAEQEGIPPLGSRVGEHRVPEITEPPAVASEDDDLLLPGVERPIIFGLARLDE
jgi:hypothetical protein